jgi:hypothetical protein
VVSSIGDCCSAILRQPNRFRRDAYAFCTLTIENLRRLNFEQKATEVQSRSKLDELIDKQTTDYLKSLDKKTRTQLSKTQLVKSHQKVHQWKQKNSQLGYSGPSRAVPKDYLLADQEPTLYSERHFEKIMSTSSDSSHSSNASASPSPQQTSLLSSVREPILEGEKWEKEVLPTYGFTLQEMGRRQIKMRDWLAKRQLKFQERDKMKKYLAALSKKDPSLTVDEMIRVYYKKKKSHDYTLEELRDIYKMKDNKDLSTNDLLKFYRNEVPLAPSGSGAMEDSSDDSPSPSNTNLPSSSPPNNNINPSNLVNTNVVAPQSAPPTTSFPTTNAIYAPLDTSSPKLRMK